MISPPILKFCVENLARQMATIRTFSTVHVYCVFNIETAGEEEYLKGRRSLFHSDRT